MAHRFFLCCKHLYSMKCACLASMSGSRGGTGTASVPPDSRPARTRTQCGGTVYPSRDNSGSSSAVMRVSSGAVKGHAGKGLRLVLPSVLPVARFVPDALLLCTQLASAGS